MYADDLALHADILQSILNIANEYATRWRYSFNDSKSVVLVLCETVKSKVSKPLFTCPAVRC